MQGFSLLSLSRRGVTELLTQLGAVDKNHYPETLSACFIVNPPSAIATILRLVTPLISPATRRKIFVLGSGPPMLAALREALGPDVHLPASVLCAPPHAPVVLPAQGAGVIDVGACCFEYIADVQRNVLSGSPDVHNHQRAVLTSLSGGVIARRATFTLIIPDGELLRKASAATEFFDAETLEHEAEPDTSAGMRRFSGMHDDAERARFYTSRMLQWAHDAARAEAEEPAATAGAPAEEAAYEGVAPRGCWLRFGRRRSAHA